MTERQAQILSSIVETYAKTAEPVGSLVLSHQFECSPATLRAEMAALEHAGYIRQPHTSAGRIPTDKGYREYVNSLAKQKGPGYTGRAAYAIDRRIRDIGLMDEAIKAAAGLLADHTGNLAFATLPHHFYSYGIANLLGNREFYDYEAAFEVAQLIDHLEEWAREAIGSDQNRLSVLIGPENPIAKGSDTSAIAVRFRSPFREDSYIGLVGPMRQDYRYVIGLVDHVGRSLEEALNG